MSNSASISTFEKAARADVPGVGRWIRVVGSGVLLGLSFPPFPFAPLAWIALVPLLVNWDRHGSARACFVDAYIAFLATFAVAFHWPLLHVFSETAWLSLPGLLVIPMWMAAPIGLSASVRRRAGRSMGFIVLVALFLLMEFGLRRGPLAFPWTLLGHSQAELYPINVLASYGGVPLLTAFVLGANVVLVAALTSARLRTSVAAAALLLPVVLTASAPQEETDMVQVGVVQPALTAERWADVYDSSRVDLLMGMTTELPPDVDLVVWPETAIPPTEASRVRIQEWVDEQRVAVLAGAIVPDSTEGFFRNAALLFAPSGGISSYMKERLVPFAEHVPFQERWPWMQRLAVPSGGVRGYLPGSGNSILEIQQHPFGVQICFETLFDDAARSFAQRGAEFIIALTQDGWWGDTFGYRQHLAFNRLRAIETGIPIIQSSVSGISALIGPDGRITDSSGWMERTSFVVSVPTRLEQTVFTRLGDWVTPAASLLLVIAALFYGVRSYL